MKRQFLRRAGLSCLILSLLLTAISCSKKPADASSPAEKGKANAPAGGPKGTDRASQGPVPVLVDQAKLANVPLQLENIGTVEAYSQVAVKSLVAGQLMQAHFQEGDDVKQGDLLFTIDPRPFEVALHQAQADLVKKQVEAKNAEVNQTRLSNLLKDKVISISEYDAAKTTAESKAADVLASKAAIEAAQLQLDYTKIHSPLTGRTGNLMVNAGNLIKSNDTQPLVLINQIHPIYVNFSLREEDLSQVRKYMTQSGGKLAVQAVIQGEEDSPLDGELSFIDNQVDSATGKFRLKAVFPNTDNRLWPGQYATVSLTLANEANQILVPTQAVQTGQTGTYIFVVKGGDTVENRTVTVGRAVDGHTIILKGIQADETIVTDGQLRLTPGAKITIKKDLNASATPGSPDKQSQGASR